MSLQRIPVTTAIRTTQVWGLFDLIYDTDLNEYFLGDFVTVGGISLGSGGGGGVTDHGALTGLSDDDHTQYLNNSRFDIRLATKNLDAIVDSASRLAMTVAERSLLAGTAAAYAAADAAVLAAADVAADAGDAATLLAADAAADAGDAATLAAADVAADAGDVATLAAAAVAADAADALILAAADTAADAGDVATLAAAAVVAAAMHPFGGVKTWSPVPGVLSDMTASQIGTGTNGMVIDTTDGPIWRIGCPNGALNSGATIAWGTGSLAFVSGNKIYYVFKTPSTMTNLVAHLGWSNHTPTGTAMGTDGAYAEILGTTLSFINRTGSADVPHGSTATLSVSTLYILKVERAASTVIFTLYSKAGAILLTGTVGTPPSASAGGRMVFHAYYNGTAGALISNHAILWAAFDHRTWTIPA